MDSPISIYKDSLSPPLRGGVFVLHNLNSPVIPNSSYYH